jgi:hypothetical protein
MRILCSAIFAPCLLGCAATSPPPTSQVVLPYSACGDMADLRNNLTATPYPSAKSDALLWNLGVRCVGAGYPAAVSARF